jgi:hypothetical protein
VVATIGLSGQAFARRRCRLTRPTSPFPSADPQALDRRTDRRLRACFPRAKRVAQEDGRDARRAAKQVHTGQRVTVPARVGDQARRFRVRPAKERSTASLDPLALLVQPGKDLRHGVGVCSVTRAAAPGALPAGTSQVIGRRLCSRNVAPEFVPSAAPTHSNHRRDVPVVAPVPGACPDGPTGRNGSRASKTTCRQILCRSGVCPRPPTRLGFGLRGSAFGCGHGIGDAPQVAIAHTVRGRIDLEPLGRRSQ